MEVLVFVISGSVSSTLQFPSDQFATDIDLGECLDNWKHCSHIFPATSAGKMRDECRCESTIAHHVKVIYSTLITESRFHKALRHAVNFLPSEKRQWGWFPIINQPAVTVGLLAIHHSLPIHPHDHPGVFGVQKVLLGKVRINQYETIDEVNEEARLVQLKLAADSVVRRNEISTFTPYKRNAHDIQSLTPNSVILSYKLTTEDADTKHFYYEVPFSKEENGNKLYNRINIRAVRGSSFN